MVVAAMAVGAAGYAVRDRTTGTSSPTASTSCQRSSRQKGTSASGARSATSSAPATWEAAAADGTTAGLDAGLAQTALAGERNPAFRRRRPAVAAEGRQCRCAAPRSAAQAVPPSRRREQPRHRPAGPALNRLVRSGWAS